jgi:predicted transcriptional regulator
MRIRSPVSSVRMTFLEKRGTIENREKKNGSRADPKSLYHLLM